MLYIQMSDFAVAQHILMPSLSFKSFEDVCDLGK